MAVHYRTRALILTEENLREADQLFMVFSKNFGKLKVLGRAIRKIKAKLRGNLRLFCLSEIEFIQGKTYKTLTDALLINDFSELKKDLKKIKAAHQIAEILDTLVGGEGVDEDIWRLLNETFDRLNSLQFTVHGLQLLYYYFLWNILAILGYRPQLYRCPLCQKKLEPKELYFYPEAGGIVCSDCHKKKEIKAIPIRSDTVKILRIILEKNYSMLKKIKIKKQNLRKIREVSQKFLSFVLTQIK
jgi:DNA repair protein RecO (recombination protein O)